MSSPTCKISKCRNVGRTDYDLITEDGKVFCEAKDLSYPICKKHLLQAITELAEQTLESEE